MRMYNVLIIEASKGGDILASIIMFVVNFNFVLAYCVNILSINNFSVVLSIIEEILIKIWFTLG